MRKHDEGYVLSYVTVVLLIFCLVATTILTGALCEIGGIELHTGAIGVDSHGSAAMGICQNGGRIAENGADAGRMDAADAASDAKQLDFCFAVFDFCAVGGSKTFGKKALASVELPCSCRMHAGRILCSSKGQSETESCRHWFGL